MLLLGFPFLGRSSFFAVLMAVTFLTIFSYFVLRFYFQTKRSEQFLILKKVFILECSGSITDKEALLPLLYQLIYRLEGEEYRYYRPPPYIRALEPILQKFSAWCHWYDVLLMKELLHSHCIREQLKTVKKNPTSLKVHMALAEGYIALYKLYFNPSGNPPYSFIEKAYSSSEMIKKFQRAAQCAVEELKIILYYEPTNKWGLMQLASIYHDLGQKEEEQKIYEALLDLAPQEKEIQFRLGSLYFQLGLMASGLKIYENLQKINDPHAEKLIDQYGLFYIT